MQLKIGNSYLEPFPPTGILYEVVITAVDAGRRCVKIHYPGWKGSWDIERTFDFCKKNWIPCTDDMLKKAKEGQKEAAKRRQEIAAAKKAKAQGKTTRRSQTEGVKGTARPSFQTKAVKSNATPRSQMEAVKGKRTPRAQTEPAKEKAKRRLQTEAMNKVIKERSDAKIARNKPLTNITSVTTAENKISLPKQIFLRAMRMQEVMGSPILRNYTIDATLCEYLKTYHYLEKDDQEKARAAQRLVDMFNVHCYAILSNAETVNYFQVSTSEFLLPSSYFGPEHLLLFIAKQLTFVIENDKNWVNEKKVAVFINIPYFVKFMNENGDRYFDQTLGNDT